jgi:hypothetical protein
MRFSGERFLSTVALPFNESRAQSSPLQALVMLRPPLNDSTLVMHIAPVVAAPQNLLHGIGSAALYTNLNVRNFFRQIFEI